MLGPMSKTKVGLGPCPYYMLRAGLCISWGLPRIYGLGRNLFLPAHATRMLTQDPGHLAGSSSSHFLVPHPPCLVMRKRGPLI